MNPWRLSQDSTFHITEMLDQTTWPLLTWIFYLGKTINYFLWRSLPHCSCKVPQENRNTASIPLYFMWSWKVANITCTTKTNDPIYTLNQSYELSWVQPHKNDFHFEIDISNTLQWIPSVKKNTYINNTQSWQHLYGTVL